MQTVLHGCRTLADHGKMVPNIASVPRVKFIVLVLESHIDWDLVPLLENRRASNRVDCTVDKCTERIVGDIYLSEHVNNKLPFVVLHTFRRMEPCRLVHLTKLPAQESGWMRSFKVESIKCHKNNCKYRIYRHRHYEQRHYGLDTTRLCNNSERPPAANSSSIQKYNHYM